MGTLKAEEQRDYDRIMHNACVTNPKYFNSTTTRKVARELLKSSMIFNSGQAYQFVAKPRGLGIYNMTLVEK